MSKRAGNKNAAAFVGDNSPGPWESWTGSLVSRYIRFISTYFRSPRGKDASQPIVLLDWQRDFLEEFLAEDISAGVLVMGRGGGKSTLMAGMAAAALYLPSDQGAAQIPIVAASLQQAKDSIYSSIEWAVRNEPELASRSLIFSGIGTERIMVPRTNGKIFPRSADPDTLQGLDIHPLGLVDEIGHLESETFNAVTMGRKRPGAKVLGAGTPGPDLETPLYLIRKLVRDGAAPKSLYYKEFSGEPGADINDEINWRLANPSLDAGFPDLEFLRNAAVMAPEPLFRTYHLAQFDIIGFDSWLGPKGGQVWDDLEDPYEFSATAPTFVGIDVGLYYDSTAIVAVQERPDGRLHAKATNVWVPTPGNPNDSTDTMQALRDLCKKYNVREISADPRLFEVPMAMLLDEHYPVISMSQSVERMTPIIQSLYELIMNSKLTHDSDDVFRTQVLSAVVRMNPVGWTLSKGKSRGLIDSAIALSLAVDRAMHKKPPRAKLVVL